ncbi:MAG TPA: SCO family protein [Verrucomicrobiae bacterium]
MRPWPLLVSAFLSALLASSGAQSASPFSNEARVFRAHGVVVELQPEKRMVVIKHAAITNFMGAMTMPFKVKDQMELAGLQRGDEITFQLHVTGTESWVDQFSKTGAVPLPADTTKVAVAAPDSKYELLHYKFTNELGQAVSLSDFPGQALAITFFYTRCPLPDYCPRLSKNFQQAAQKLAAMTNAPANWHFLSVSFDPEFDSPAMLQAYGRSYQYDPAHWSFLTGPADKISRLAQRSGVTVAADGAAFNHNFRTLIIDASGHLQMVFVTGGDLSDQIAAEIIKAAAATNAAVAQNQNR